MTTNNVNINEKDIHGRTALMNACLNGNDKLVSSLLQQGANICEKGEFDMTALFYAMLPDRCECFRLLLIAGADLRAKNCHNHDIRRFASTCLSPECIELLSVMPG